MTAQKAIERSINTIPVALAHKMGVQTCYDFLTQKLDLKNLNENDINLSSMGLGGTSGGVTTLESAAAYAIFGNGGLYYEPTFYTKVTDQKGNIVLEKNPRPKTAIGDDTAMIMNKLLQTVIYGKNGTATSVASSVKKMKLFGKTGTSSSDNDKWFVGGSPYYVVSSWCGYATMQKMPSANLSIAKNQWSTVMSKIHKGLKEKDYPESKFVVDRFYCTETGGLATEECEKTSIGWYNKGRLPEVCQKHSGELLGTPEEVEKQKEESKKEESSSSQDNDTTSSTKTESTTSKP
jgi:penicillin-binding protein 1A